jgi:SOS response associated peptidase (SRAP)
LIRAHIGGDALDPADHLDRRPTGKGQQHRSSWIGAEHDPMRHAMGQRVGLASARAGNDEERRGTACSTAWRCSGLSLARYGAAVMWIETNRQCHQQARLWTFLQISHPMETKFARWAPDRHLPIMCGRVIQSSGPLRYGIVEGLDLHDSRVHNYPPRWNAAPSQELPVIRRNHQTGEVSLDPLRWGLIPSWCQDPKGGRKPINAKCGAAAFAPSTASMSGKRSRDGRRSSPTRSP